MNNNLIAWLLVKLGRIIFYSGAYRYKKTGEKVPYKYSYHIEHVELTRKSEWRGRVLDYWLKMDRNHR